MKAFNLLTVGIGGEGVLTSGVLIARAAHIENKKVVGLQLHGLSQRGGTIPVFVRFGEVYAPTIPRGQADLVIASEPAEAMKFAKYGSKEKTIFVIDYNPVKSCYSNIANEHYPTKEEIRKSINHFAKKVYFVDASKECSKKFGSPIFGCVSVIGVVMSLGVLPLKKESIIQAIKESIKYQVDKNLEAFEYGFTEMKY